MAIAKGDVGPELAGQSDLTDDAIFCDINITPFTDVILVLLIIFMVSSSAMVDAAREGRLDVSLPQAGHASPAEPRATPLVIGIAQDGRTFARGDFISAEQLQQLLRKTYAADPNTQVIVDADGTLSHKEVVRVIDCVRAAGFAVVGIGAESGG